MRPLALGGLALVLGATGVLGIRHAADLRTEVEALRERQAEVALERTAAEAALRGERIRLALERAREAPFAAAAPYLELVLKDGRLLLGRGEARLREIAVQTALEPGIRAVERIEADLIVLGNGMTLRRARPGADLAADVAADSDAALGASLESTAPREITLLPGDFEALRAVLRVGDLAYVH